MKVFPYVLNLQSEFEIVSHVNVKFALFTDVDHFQF